MQREAGDQRLAAQLLIAFELDRGESFLAGAMRRRGGTCREGDRERCCGPHTTQQGKNDTYATA
jgi:hypothetical protein